jgi:hypothetical protein
MIFLSQTPDAITNYTSSDFQAINIRDTQRQSIFNVNHLKVDETPGQYDHRIFEWIVME